MEGQSLPPFLIHQSLKNIKALFTSLLLELAEMEFWPAFVWFWPTVQCSGIKTLGSNYPIMQHLTTEDQNSQLHHCTNLNTSLICLDTQRETTETLSQYSQFPTRNLNLKLTNMKEECYFHKNDIQFTILFSINPIIDAYHVDV
jgi:hypothetical protein